MKLIAMSDDAFCTFALFSVDGEELFLNHYKLRGVYSITNRADEELDFSRQQCKDIYQELKKQYNYGRKK